MSSLSKAFIRSMTSLFLFGIEGEIVRLERVVLQVEELDVVVAQNLLERFWRIEVGGGVVARELVLPVENETQKSSFVEFGLQFCQGRRGFPWSNCVIACEEIAESMVIGPT